MARKLLILASREPIPDRLLEDKVNSLADILNQIQLDILKRQELSQSVINQVYDNYCSLRSKLFQLEFWELGVNRGIDIRRGFFEKQLDSLKQEVRKEQVQCWSDVSKLKKEFRTWLKQYSDLVQRVRSYCQKWCLGD